jgi:hypothetical protein
MNPRPVLAFTGGLCDTRLMMPCKEWRAPINGDDLAFSTGHVLLRRLFTFHLLEQEKKTSRAFDREGESAKNSPLYSFFDTSAAATKTNQSSLGYSFARNESRYN